MCVPSVSTRWKDLQYELCECGLRKLYAWVRQQPASMLLDVPDQILLPTLQQKTSAVQTRDSHKRFATSVVHSVRKLEVVALTQRLFAGVSIEMSHQPRQQNGRRTTYNIRQEQNLLQAASITALPPFKGCRMHITAQRIAHKGLLPCAGRKLHRWLWSQQPHVVV